ncbi:hypothetical protein GALMADRAFT_51291, partial [Galerina marginata CBS 339.88]
SETLEEFQAAFPQLLDLIFEHESDARTSQACSCGSGANRTTRCYDCFCYEPSCFFIRHDIAALRDEIAAVNLGHYGLPCPSKYATNLKFTVIDVNGIHQTRIRFCSCEGFPDRSQQLMKARLFPATMSQPTTAFTFQVLKQFHLLHLEGKLSAYDFIGALRRLSDNAFPQRTAPGWERTPPQLRHLIQIQYTADGNHHSNKYAKNTDPDDISLYDGKAYYPRDAEYREYIKNLPKGAPEAAPCDHLNVHTKQNRKKFKNMELTGIVNIQCGHIFIKSTVDLQLGEKHGNVDYALDHAILNTKPQPVSELYLAFVRVCDHIFSYDNSCSLCVNALKRFIENFPDEAELVEKFRWLIPLLHVQNHKDNCTYLYSSAYVRGAGHFHGETAEMPWVELNQLAPQTRQMNNGH